MKQTGRAALLDVNFLIALIDPAHDFHDAAHSWFRQNRKHGWATCPITENACLRVLSKPGYPYSGLTVEQVRDVLSELTALEGHRFWPDSVSMLDSALFDLAAAGPKNLTDLYLLRLAAANAARLVTFDRTIQWQGVTGCGPNGLELLTGGKA